MFQLKKWENKSTILEKAIVILIIAGIIITIIFIDMKFTKENNTNFGKKEEKKEKNVTEQTFEIEVLRESILSPSKFLKSEKYTYLTSN